MESSLIPFVLCVLSSSFFLDVRAHTLGMGSCPPIKPMKSFEMEKFLGSWYVIEKFTSSDCLMYNFEEGDDKIMRIIQTSQRSVVGSIGVYNFTYTGVLTFPDVAKEPGRMKVKFPLNVAGKADYLIFMTDYDNYGVIFTCQELPIGHRKSMSVLSRTPTLSKEILDQVHQQARAETLNPSELETISHSKCKNSNSTSNVKFDDKTFSGSDEPKTEEEKLRVGTLGAGGYRYSGGSSKSRVRGR